MNESSPVPASHIIEAAISTANITFKDMPSPSYNSQSHTSVSVMDIPEQHVTQNSQADSMDTDSEISPGGPQEKPTQNERILDKNLLSPEARPKSHPSRMSPTHDMDTQRPEIMVYSDSGKDTPPSISMGNSPPGAPQEIYDTPVHTLVVTNEKGEATFNAYSTKDKLKLDPVRCLAPYVNSQSLKEEQTFPITCGNSKGELVWRKFICPGINAKCVSCNNSWYTPKEFVQIAGKHTLKDWKRAIRINGTMLRKMIENGELDYYGHATNCSNQCKSNKNASFETTNSFDADTRDRESHDRGRIERCNSDDNSVLTMKRNMLTSVQRISQESGVSSLERSSSEDSGVTGSSPQLDSVLMRETIASQEKLQELHQFWIGMSQTEIFDDFVRELINKVGMIQQRAKQQKIMPLEDAVMMTNITNSLDLFPIIRQKMANHKHNVERQASDIINQRMDLERQLAEKKMDENELKRKSQHLDNVLSLTPSTDKRKKNHIWKLSRQKAIESRNSPYNQSCSTVVTSQSRMDLQAPTSMLRFTDQLSYPAALLHSSQIGRMVPSSLLQIPSMVSDPPFNHNLPKK